MVGAALVMRRSTAFPAESIIRDAALHDRWEQAVSDEMRNHHGTSWSAQTTGGQEHTEGT